MHVFANDTDKYNRDYYRMHDPDANQIYETRDVIQLEKIYFITNSTSKLTYKQIINTSKIVAWKSNSNANLNPY